MYSALLRVWLAHERGTDEVPSRATPPPHLCDRAWRFVCGCGYSWNVAKADPEVRDARWAPPRRECVSCHTWVDGAPIEPRRDDHT